MKLKVVTVLFALLIVVVIILVDKEQLQFVRVIYEFPLGDKITHFVLFGMLSFLINLTFLRSLPGHNPRLLVFDVTVPLAFVVAVEEWSQRFFPQRTPDWIDLLFSFAGIALGAWIAYLSAPAGRKQPPRRP